MKGKRYLIALVALCAMAAAGFVAYRLESPRAPALCQVCDRPIMRQTAFRMETKKGTIEACCPACAIHYMIDHAGTVNDTQATDFTSGRMIPAKSAYYDEGGDVQYCTLHRPAMERSPQGVSERVYDRCLPVLVAFASRDAAEAYRQQHGGRILTYDETLASLRSE